MIGTVLYNILEFINFYLVYKAILNIRFKKKKLLYAAVVGISCAVQVLVCYFVDDTWKDIITIAMGFVAAMVLSTSKKCKVALLYPIVFFIAGLINTLGSYFWSFVNGISQRELCESMFWVCVSECTAILLLLVYSRFKNKINREEIHLTAYQHFLLIVAIVCFFIIFSFSQGLYDREWQYWEKIKMHTLVASLLLAVSFVLLSFSLFSTWKKAFQYKVEKEKYDLFLRQQEEHIRTLIVEDEKRRKLRHDMRAHMVALQSMIEKEDWTQLREYFGQMQEGICEEGAQQYTHISAVDAIIGQWHKKALEKQASWTFEGNMTAPEQITLFELCVLFSNLLSNAVEAIEKVETDKKIQVRVKTFQGQLVISAANTCVDSLQINTRPTTSKEDELLHGLGLKNVEDIVKKHHGKIEYEAKDGWFRVDVVV